MYERRVSQNAVNMKITQSWDKTDDSRFSNETKKM